MKKMRNIKNIVENDFLVETEADDDVHVRNVDFEVFRFYYIIVFVE